MILRDFKCQSCGILFEDFIDRGQTQTDCECGGIASKAFITRAPAVLGCESFNPHFDIQLGAHFQSKEDKKSFLKKHDREQVSGLSSPRKTIGSSVVCTKEQGQKLYLKKKERKHGSNQSRSGK